MDAIVTAVTTAVSQVSGASLDVVSGVLPQAMVIFGALLVIRLGKKAFKTVSN